jgi:hypothetical protein
VRLLDAEHDGIRVFLHSLTTDYTD